MTKKQKAAAVAASRRYRAKKKTAKLRGSSEIASAARRIVTAGKVVKDTGSADEVLFHINAVRSIIGETVDAALKSREAEQAQPDHSIERMADDGCRAGYPMAADAPAMSRIGSLIDRLHSINTDLGRIRAENGELLQGNLGYREKGFGGGVPVGATTKAEPVSKLGSVEDLLSYISEKIIDIHEQGKLFNAVLG